MEKKEDGIRKKDNKNFVFQKGGNRGFLLLEEAGRFFAVSPKRLCTYFYELNGGFR